LCTAFWTSTRQFENELEALKRESARSNIDGIIASQKTIDGTTVISAEVNGVDPSVLREVTEQIGAKIAAGIVVLDVASNGLVGFVSKDLQRSSTPGKS
jgi:alanyl-tRNA synthetase